MTLWEGRLGGQTAQEVMAYSVSLPFDRRLAADDLAGSRAHVRGLGHAGILPESEVSILIAALERVEVEILGGAFEFHPEDEDIHTAVERRVTEIAGDVGAKLHTGRSRNDQVATDLRLYARRELLGIAARVLGLQQVLARRAAEAGEAYLPGYTHLQRAQPVLLAHWLLAHGWALARDVDRLLQCVSRLDVCPLGAGALAGSSLPLDPDWVAAELGFGARFENSLDAVSDRDFVAEGLFCLALLGVHLSRLGEELVLWSSDEFGFVTLDDGYATGSSMLPQKKNPDVAELARAKSGRLVGHLAGLLATLKGLPFAYNRDLLEDKEPLFDTVDTVRPAVQLMAGLLDNLTLRPERLAAALHGGFLTATDLADYLVTKGVAFRTAHEQVGNTVRYAEAHDQELWELSLEEIRQFAPLAEPDVFDWLKIENSVARRRSPGGTAPERVREALERAEAEIGLNLHEQEI